MILIKPAIRQILQCTLLLLWLVCLPSFAEGVPLPENQAFAFHLSVTKSNQAMAEWEIAPGYYLYSKRVRITMDSALKPIINYPQGELKYDAERGRFEAFSGSLLIPVLFSASDANVRMGVDYQGCSEDGFCYPPTHREFNLNLINRTVTEDVSVAPITSTGTSLQTLLTDQNSVRSLLDAKHLGVVLLVFAMLGLLLAFTPCVLPMIPILMGIIVGHKESVSTKKAFFLSGSYVLGSAITYALAGLLVASLGSTLQVWLQKPWIIAATSALFVLLALSLFGVYELQLPRALQNSLSRFSDSRKRGSYAGVFVMGMISTLIVSPCVTAPLVGVLMYIAQTGDRLLGASALFAMGIGMGLPLLFIGTSAGKWLPKSGAWMDAVKKIFGILMLGMAIWLISRVISPMLVMVLWGILLLAIAIFLILYLPTVIGRRKLNRTIGFLVGLSGMLVVVAGIGMPTQLSNWIGAVPAMVNHEKTFVVVHDISALQKQLLLAKQDKKPVILDFYADWCESCVVMDRKVFNLPTVKQQLKPYVLLRADLTENSANDQMLLTHYGVIAPPTVLFFDDKGKEINSQRIVGEVDANEFLTRLAKVQGKVLKN